MPRKLEHHGLTAGKKQPPEYQIWSQIKQRCFNKKHPKYRLYGKRGIDMDPRWRASYVTFIAEVGPRPRKGFTIERIDNSKGYWPGNVRWATPKEQNRNKRTNRVIKVNGQNVCVSQAAETAVMDRRRVRERLESGLTPDQAVSLPVEHGIKYYPWRGITHKLGEWARILKISYHTLYSRIEEMGWSTERAFTTPLE